MQKEKFYTTNDLSLATLISLYIPIEHIDRNDSSRVVFVFERSKELDRLVEAYFRKELQVEPQTYFQQLRLIKSRLHQED